MEILIDCVLALLVVVVHLVEGFLDLGVLVHLFSFYLFASVRIEVVRWRRLQKREDVLAQQILHLKRQVLLDIVVCLLDNFKCVVASKPNRLQLVIIHGHLLLETPHIELRLR